MISYTEILKELKYKGETYNCHVDPDLDTTRRKQRVDGFLFCTFIIALIGLLYQIFKEKK